MKKTIIAAVFAVFACAAFAEISNIALPHVVIAGFANKTGDPSFDTPSTTATDSLALTIRLLGSYEIVASESAPPTGADKELLAWCETESVDYVLYGSITAPKGGAQAYDLAVFDREKGKTTIRKTAKGSSIFDVFSCADTLTFAVIDAIAGRHVGFGSIAFEIANPEQSEGAAIISLDGTKIAEGFGKIECVVEGNHLVSVKQIHDKVTREIFLAEIEVAEGETATVIVEIPIETMRSQSQDAGIEEGLVFVKGGTFTMGSDTGPQNERPAHEVTVGSFWMSETEITQGEFKSMTGWMENSTFAQKKIGQRYPVILSDWMHAINYCNARSAREGLTPAYKIKYDKVAWNRLANGYRLPTEAEWEYAAKGGMHHDEFLYPGSNDVAEVAITSQTANGNGYATVGTKKPNFLSLYDMGGNVYEWCWDVYKPYRKAGDISKEKASSDRIRAIRGGDSSQRNTQARCAARSFSNQQLNIPGIADFDTSRNIGFRVVRSVMDSEE